MTSFMFRMIGTEIPVIIDILQFYPIKGKKGHEMRSNFNDFFKIALEFIHYIKYVELDF